MIHANKARKIMKKANKNSVERKAVIEKIMPVIDTHIHLGAERGCNQITINTIGIERIIGFVTMTKQEMMDIIKEEVESYGYRVLISPNYTFIHITW